MLKDAAAIVGIGETPFAKGLPETETELALRAILAALADAGIDPAEVDGLASYTLETTDEVEIAANLGAGGPPPDGGPALRGPRRRRGGAQPPASIRLMASTRSCWAIGLRSFMDRSFGSADRAGAPT